MRAFLISFFISLQLVAADDFHTVLYEWTDHVDYQRFKEADEAYLELMAMCVEINDVTKEMECEILKVLHEYYFSSEGPESEKQLANKAQDLLKEIREKNIYSPGTIQLFNILNGELFWTLSNEESSQFLDDMEWHVSAVESYEIDEVRKIEHKIYLYENLAYFYGPDSQQVHEKEIFYLDEILKLIEFTKETLDYENWESGIKRRKLESYDYIGDEAKALELSLEIFSDSINDYELSGDLEPLITILMDLGARELSIGNDSRSDLYLTLAYSMLKKIDFDQMGQNNYWHLDQLMYQLLPSLNCEDSEELINLFDSSFNFVKDNSNNDANRVSEDAENSIMLNSIWCSEDDKEQEQASLKLFKKIDMEIDETIENYYQNFNEETHISHSYFANKISYLSDLELFMDINLIQGAIEKIQSIFHAHLASGIFISQPRVNLGYALILSEGICRTDRTTARNNLTIISQLLEEHDLNEYIIFSERELSDLYLNLILLPANCGFEKESKSLFEVVKKINLDPDPFNILSERAYGLKSFKFLAESIHGTKKLNTLETEYLLQDLKDFNREPNELGFYLRSNKSSNEDVAEYLEYQSFLSDLDQNLNKATKSQLDLVNGKISSFLDKLKTMSSPDMSIVSEFIYKEFYREFTIRDIKKKISEKESFIAYSYTWLEINNNMREFLTQICISTDGTFVSHKILKNADSNLIFNINDILLEDLITKRENHENISNQYYKVFSKNFTCNPADFRKVSLISNFNELFNPSLFFDDGYIIKDTELNVFQNIYRFLDWQDKSTFLQEYTGFGDIDYGETKYTELPLSREEIILSSDYFQNKKLFLDERAVKKNVGNIKDSFIHFATHNDTIDIDGNLINVLVLSGDENNRYLQSTDIANNNFKNSFVVLSACDSFANSVVGRNTTSSLYNAFLISGASGILSTMWDVESSAAKEFTTNFFQYFSLSRSLDESYRQAQLKLQMGDNLYHPYYWAAFNLYH